MASLSSLLNPSTGSDSTDATTRQSAGTPNNTIIDTNTAAKSSTPMSITDIIMNQASENDKLQSDTKPKIRERKGTPKDKDTTPPVTEPNTISLKLKSTPQYNNTYSTSYTPVIPGYSNTYQDQINKKHVNSTNPTTESNSTNPGSTDETDRHNEHEHMRTYQTLLINSRSRHLKKNDGEPYWRNEIQFKFLMSLFFNHHRVFRNPYYNTFHGFDWPSHFKFYRDENGDVLENKGEMLNFFELYLITLLKSSKISKILKARLMVDIHYALNFTIICLLVNIGRLNTTVNFDYEMRSQFRTYHSIPSLQVGNHDNIIEQYYPVSLNKEGLTDVDLKHSDSGLIMENGKLIKNSKKNSNTNLSKTVNGSTISTVKQLQDTPRIKSILKSVNDLSGNSPKSYSEFIETIAKEYHGLNIVSVIFFLCANEYEIGQSFFPFDLTEPTNPKTLSTGSLLNDIWLRPKFKSTDKLNKFLWLIYTVMETGLKVPRIMANPFNDELTVGLSEINQSADLAAEIAIIDHKKPYISPTIMKIKLIIPKWSSLDQAEPINPMLNDFDTAQEVEFAAQMKRLRVQFVENETHNTTITTVRGQKDQGENGTNVVIASNDSKANARSVVSRNGTRKRARVGSNEFAPRFYNPDGTEIDQKGSGDLDFGHSDTTVEDHNRTLNEDGSNGHYPFNNYHMLNNISDDEFGERILNDASLDVQGSDQRREYELNFDGIKKRPNDESVEMSATNPLIMSNYEDNVEDKDAIGFFNYGYAGPIVSDLKRENDGSLYVTSCVKKKKRRQILADPAIKNTVNDLVEYLNKDYKYINAFSKNAANRREKNTALGEFMYQIILFKQSQAQQLRFKEGNWKHFTKHMWDVNMLVEKELKRPEYNFEKDLKRPDYDYGDWGEFKTNMNKTLNHVNIVINERTKINSNLGRNGEDELEFHASFLDDIFESMSK